MADRLTQLQDAVNSVSNCTRLIPSSSFPRESMAEKEVWGTKLGSGEWTEAGLQQQALGLAGGGAAVWKVWGRLRGQAGAGGLFACQVEDLTAWTVRVHRLALFSGTGFIFLSVVLMDLSFFFFFFCREERGSGSFFSLRNFNPPR